MRCTRSLIGSLERAEYQWWTTSLESDTTCALKMELLHAVLAFKLLEAASPSIQNKQLALIACLSVSFAAKRGQQHADEKMTVSAPIT